MHLKEESLGSVWPLRPVFAIANTDLARSKKDAMGQWNYVTKSKRSDRIIQDQYHWYVRDSTVLHCSKLMDSFFDEGLEDHVPFPWMWYVSFPESKSIVGFLFRWRISDEELWLFRATVNEKERGQRMQMIAPRHRFLSGMLTRSSPQNQ